MFELTLDPEPNRRPRLAPRRRAPPGAGARPRPRRRRPRAPRRWPSGAPARSRRRSGATRRRSRRCRIQVERVGVAREALVLLAREAVAHDDDRHRAGPPGRRREDPRVAANALRLEDRFPHRRVLERRVDAFAQEAAVALRRDDGSGRHAGVGERETHERGEERGRDGAAARRFFFRFLCSIFRGCCRRLFCGFCGLLCGHARSRDGELPEAVRRRSCGARPSARRTARPAASSRSASRATRCSTARPRDPAARTRSATRRSSTRTVDERLREILQVDAAATALPPARRPAQAGARRGAAPRNLAYYAGAIAGSRARTGPETRARGIQSHNQTRPRASTGGEQQPETPRLAPLGHPVRHVALISFDASKP